MTSILVTVYVLALIAAVLFIWSHHNKVALRVREQRMRRDEMAHKAEFDEKVLEYLAQFVLVVNNPVGSKSDDSLAEVTAYCDICDQKNTVLIQEPVPQSFNFHCSNCEHLIHVKDV